MLDPQPVRDSPETPSHRSRNPVAAQAHAAAWRADVVAGSVGSIVTLASWLTLPLLAFVALGPSAAPVGMLAGGAASLVGGFVVAVIGRSAMPAAGLSSATMLLFAAAVATLSTDPAMQPLSRPGHLAVLLATISCCVVLMGALQMLFGWLRLGVVAKYVPQPVLAGFMNSVAVL
ncbi:MAG TPA: SulP family inorganic anion transporter, partial [Caldimonas sp.]